MKHTDKKSTSITTFDEHLDSRYGLIGTASRTDFTPFSCPKIRCSPCCFAQRPLPSMMIAMCCGNFSRFIFSFISLVSKQNRSACAERFHIAICYFLLHTRAIFVCWIPSLSTCIVKCRVGSNAGVRHHCSCTTASSS